MNVMEITSCFLIEVKAPFTEKVHACYYKSSQYPKVGKFIDPRGQPTILISLTGHSIKLYSKFLTLCP